MTSMALQTWHGERAQRMDELLDVHGRVRDVGGEHGIGTRQIELALTQRLASEFQGFARDLHDEGIDVVYGQMDEWNPVWARTFRQLLLLRRDLDRRNASPSTLASDFERFGLDLWPDLIRSDRRCAHWQGSLERLNVATNALVHDDVTKLRRLATDGVSLDIEGFLVWRRAADAVAVAMDRLLAEHLAETLRAPVPW